MFKILKLLTKSFKQLLKGVFGSGDDYVFQNVHCWLIQFGYDTLGSFRLSKSETTWVVN